MLNRETYDYSSDGPDGAVLEPGPEPGFLSTEIDMNASTLHLTRPEALGDVPGVCEVPLTRAIVQYRDVHEMDTPGGRIEDIGLGLVLEGRYASSAEVVDLGSGKVKILDLSTELVVLDWVYEPTLEHVAGLVTAAASTGEPEALKRYVFRLGLGVLERMGFGPLTRPAFLRVGFRDICRDLDLHEGTSIRVVMGPGSLTRAHLDYDAAALIFRTASSAPDARLEHALAEAFPEGELRRLVPLHEGSSLDYQVRFSLPETFSEARHALGLIRRGLVALIARFEPDRYKGIAPLLETFGARETLATLAVHEPPVRGVRIEVEALGSTTIH